MKAPPSADDVPPPVGRRSFYSHIFLAALLYVVIASFPILSPIILSFLLILLISIAVNPIVAHLRRLSGGRARATAMVVCGFLLVIGLTGWAFYGPLKTSTGRFVERLPHYWERIQKPLVRMEHKAALSEKKVKEEVSREVGTNHPPQVALPPPPVEASPAHPSPPSTGFIHSALSQLFTGASSSFKLLAINAASMIVVFLTVFFGVIFTLFNPRPLIFTFFSLLPKRYHGEALRIGHRVVEVVPRWALATLLSMLLIGLLTFLIMWPLLGFQDALLLGVVAGILEAIPYIGPILSAVPGVLLALGEGGMTPVWVLIGYLAVQAVENNIVTPLIMAGRLKLHPLAVIFSMLICVGLFGVLGVLLSAPLVAIVQILHQESYRPRFLPEVTDRDLDKISLKTFQELRTGSDEPKAALGTPAFENKTK